MTGLAPDLTCAVVYTPTFTWWFPAAGLAVMAGAAVFGLFARGFARWWCFGIAGFALLWALGMTVRLWTLRHDLRAALVSPSALVVEGPVANYHRPPVDGDDESFTVSGVPFFYSDHVITGGFNQSVLHGGPIHSGLDVRIHYVTGLRGQGNLIIQLETCR